MTPDPKILPYFNKIKNDDFLSTKAINNFLSSERTVSRNNVSRKTCLRELQDLLQKKRMTKPLRETLLYYALQQDLNRRV